MAFPKSVLEVRERVVLVCKAQDMGADDMFQELTGYTGEGNRSIVAWAVHITLLIYWGHNSLGPVCWCGAVFQGLIEEGCEWGSVRLPVLSRQGWVTCRFLLLCGASVLTTT